VVVFHWKPLVKAALVVVHHMEDFVRNRIELWKDVEHLLCINFRAAGLGHSLLDGLDIFEGRLD